MEQIDQCRYVPRDSFNNRLLDRYWDIPTDIPQATQLNTPIGTRPCDKLAFMCHPQKYKTFHRGRIFDGSYSETDIESSLYNMDQYNPFDMACKGTKQQLQPSLIAQQYSGPQRTCPTTPRLWNNNSKLFKYNQH
jgi:hypothetical protein